MNEFIEVRECRFCFGIMVVLDGGEGVRRWWARLSYFCMWFFSVKKAFEVNTVKR